jgi:hypothetical protein
MTLPTTPASSKRKCRHCGASILIFAGQGAAHPLPLCDGFKAACARAGMTDAHCTFVGVAGDSIVGPLATQKGGQG